MRRPLPKVRKKSSLRSSRVFLLGPSELNAKKLGKLLVSEAYARARDGLIAIDGGLDLCHKLGLKPDLAVGDWDSLRNKALLKKYAHVSLPPRKDRSDFFFALHAAEGAKHIIGLGLTGGRPDHQHAVFSESLLALKAKIVDRVSFPGSDADFHFFRGGAGKSIRLETEFGQSVSVFPCLGPARGISLFGLQYGLRDAALDIGSRGLSNIACANTIEIRARSGILMVVLVKSDYS